MNYSEKHVDLKSSTEYSSDVTLNCVNHVQNFTRKCDGIIFTGRQDGRVLVCYNKNLIIPMSYSLDEGKTFIKADKDLTYLKKIWKEKSKEFTERSITPEDLEITKYKFNEDGTLDVFESVLLDVLLKVNVLRELPFKFGIVDGNFNCSYNILKSLEGAPEKVNDNFDELCD